MLLEAVKINKHFGDRLVLSLETLRVNRGDKIGIVGANGAGKTTLLNMLAGEIKPDSGAIRRFCSITYIHQFSDEKAQGSQLELSRYRLMQKLDQDKISGGEQTRIKLANAFSENNPLFFADEPTANLDEQGVALFVKQLREVDTLLLVSHDRSLLDAVCTHILAIEKGVATLYEGNYSAYVRQMKERLDRQAFEYDQYVREKERLEAVAQDIARRAQKVTNTTGRSKGSIIEKDGAGVRSKGTQQKNMQRAAKAAISRVTDLEKMEKPKGQAIIKIDFSLTNPPGGKWIVTGSGVDFCYEKLTILKDAAFTLVNRSHTALVGPNGCGKTTLLRLISQGYPGITVTPSAKLGMMQQDFSDMDPAHTVLEYATADSIQAPAILRAILAQLLFRGDDIYKPIGVLSGGEKIRLALARLVTSAANVLILDEPTNYLDIPSLEAVQELLREYQGTLLFVSHDRAFVDAVATDVWRIEDGRIRTYQGNLTAFEQSLIPHPQEALILKMRLSQIALRIGRNDSDKETLEAEYRRTLEELRQIEKP